MTLTDQQLNELCEIGAKYIYTGIKNERHLTWSGVSEIIKRYDKMKKEHDIKLSETIAEWDAELEEQLSNFVKKPKD